MLKAIQQQGSDSVDAIYSQDDDVSFSDIALLFPGSDIEAVGEHFLISSSETIDEDEPMYSYQEDACVVRDSVVV